MLLNVIVILLTGLSGGTVEKSKDVPLQRHDKLSPMNIIRQKGRQKRLALRRTMTTFEEYISPAWHQLQRHGGPGWTAIDTKR